MSVNSALENFDKGLVKSILDEFRCPVCSKFMFPPIRQCENGHCFCRKCFEEIKKCTICFQAKSTTRPFDLENISDVLNFPCRYTYKGCNFTGKSKTVEDHEADCKFSIILCPLRFNDCDWSGKRSQLLSHSEEHHPGNVFSTEAQRFVVTNFSRKIDRKYYIILEAFNNIFRLTWDLNAESGLMRFAVYTLDKTSEMKSFWFSYEVSVLSEGVVGKEVIQLKAQCYDMEDDSEMFLKDNYMTVNYDMVQNFCDANGSFHFMLRLGRFPC